MSAQPGLLTDVNTTVSTHPGPVTGVNITVSPHPGLVTGVNIIVPTHPGLVTDVLTVATHPWLVTGVNITVSTHAHGYLKMYTCQHAQGYLQTDIQVCQHTRQTYKYVNTTDRHTSMSTHQGLPTGVHMAVKPRAAYVQSVCVHVLGAASRGARHSVLTHARHSVLTRAHHSVLTHAHHSALTHPALQASRALWVALPPTDPLQ